MHYIVFDLEWNIAGHANRVDPAVQAAMPFEIIEIGAVKLDENFRQISKFSVYIRPKIYPILSGHIAAVTNRLQQSLKYGLTFPDAAHEFFTWCGEDFMFCTWTESDTPILKMNLKFFGLDDHLAGRCLDVQYVFDNRIEKADIQRSIEYALDFLKLPKNQTFHQAVSDAFYTGEILRAIADILKVEEPGLDFIERFAYDPNQSRSYQMTLIGHQTAESALDELRAQSVSCPACGETLTLTQEWTRSGPKAEALFNCATHGRVLGKCRFRLRGSELMKTSVSIRIDRDQEPA